MKKGISPLVATVVLIIMVFGIAGVVGPWLLDLARTTTQQSGSDVQNKMLCKNFAYDFETDYGTQGILLNQSVILVKIENKGTINAYNFSIEITDNQTIKTLSIESPILQANPLKPGESAILRANITGIGTIKSVKVLNDVCPDKYIEQEL